jgi:hypothetical protein
MELTELKRAANSLIVEYNKNFDASEFYFKSFKHQAQNLLLHMESATALDLCHLIQACALGGCYPDIETVSREQNFSKVKIFKN